MTHTAVDPDSFDYDWWKSLSLTEIAFKLKRTLSLILFSVSLPFEGQAKVRESLSYTAYKNMLKNILRYKESVEPQDLQQFVILKDSLELGASVIRCHVAVSPIFFLSSSMASLPSSFYTASSFLCSHSLLPLYPHLSSVGLHLVFIIIHYLSSPHIIQTFNLTRPVHP